nr:hypothetical protein [Tanacetum cinerariifolium]
DGGVSGVSLSEESSVDDKNGKIAGSGEGGITEVVVLGIVVGIVPNKITHPVDVPTLSSDEYNETEITEIAMTCTSKSLYKYPLYQPCMMREKNDQMGE